MRNGNQALWLPLRSYTLTLITGGRRFDSRQVRMFVFRLGELKAYFGTRLATGCGSRVSGAPLTASPGMAMIGPSTPDSHFVK